MSRRDDIFPNPPAQDGNVLRLGLVGSWESQFLGLGRLTAFLTPRLMKQSHAVDDMGLYVLFLQRHRVEVGLKLILERANGRIPKGHRIKPLFAACANACVAIGFRSPWDTFVSSQREYGDLIDDVDPSAATFRYPVDTRANPWLRRPLVDLVALEAAGAAYERDVVQLIGQLAALEGVPVSADEAEPAVADLMAVTRGCRGVLRVQRESMDALRVEWRRVSGGRADPRREADAYQAYDAVVDVSETLATRTEAMAVRIAQAHGVELPESSREATRGPMPQISLIRPTRAQQEAQIKWFVDGLISQMRPLGRAVACLQERSKSWTAPAARQVYLDATRFRSRLHRAMTY